MKIISTKIDNKSNLVLEWSEGNKIRHASFKMPDDIEEGSVISAGGITTKTLTSISASTTKTSYFVGESVDKSKIQVIGTFDDSSTRELTQFTVSPATLTEVNPSQTITITETYDSQALTTTITVAVVPEAIVTAYYGATDAIPTSVSQLTSKQIASRDLTASAGYEQKIIAGNITTGYGQYVTFAIPNTYKVVEWQVAGFSIALPFTKGIEGNYSIYYLNSPSYDLPDGINYKIFVEEV